MKKLTLLFIIATVFIACNKTTTIQEDSKNNLLLLTPNGETIFTYDSKIDSARGQTKLNIEDWIGRLTFYNQLSSEVMAGKLNAYKNYPKEKLTVDEFKKINVKPVDIARMRYHEKVWLDTVNYKIKKEVSFISFDGAKKKESTGEAAEYYKLFDIKLND